MEVIGSQRVFTVNHIVCRKWEIKEDMQLQGWRAPPKSLTYTWRT